MKETITSSYKFALAGSVPGKISGSDEEWTNAVWKLGQWKVAGVGGVGSGGGEGGGYNNEICAEYKMSFST